MSHARKSLAHLADKFNTAPPPGYVPGRGRGVSGFSKPPDEPPKRGSAPPARAGAGSSSTAGASSSEGVLASSTADDTAAAVAAAAGDAGDTRELDLSETQAYEEKELSMDATEAGGTVEAFNMHAERQEGHFDDDFNYVWKDKKGDDDDVKDAWLTEVDGNAEESEEKVAKRRKMLEGQMRDLEADVEAVDTAAVRRAAAALLQPRESVAGGLKRLSAKPKPAKKQGRQSKAAAAAAGAAEEETEEARAQKRAQFERLTEAADQLLRAGDLDIYTATKEKLEEKAAQEAEQAAAAAAEAAAAEAAAGGGGGAGAPPDGVSQAVHDAAVAGGFLPQSGGLYFNGDSNLYFDPRSSLYWPVGASDEGPYFYFDSERGEFVLYDAAAGGAAQADLSAAAAAEQDDDDDDGDDAGRYDDGEEEMDGEI